MSKPTCTVSISSLNKPPLHTGWARLAMLGQVNPMIRFSPPFSRPEATTWEEASESLHACPSRNVQRHFGHRLKGPREFSSSVDWLLIIQASGRKDRILHISQQPLPSLKQEFLLEISLTVRKNEKSWQETLNNGVTWNQKRSSQCWGVAGLDMGLVFYCTL